MAYVDYDFYRDEFGLGVIPESEFKGFALKAQAFLSSVADISSLSFEAKCAICEVADVYYNFPETVSAESADGYSVTYQSGRGINSYLLNAAKKWLANTGTMYAGVR